MRSTLSFSLNPNFISISLNPNFSFLSHCTALTNLHKLRKSGIPRPSILVIGDSDIRKSMIHESISKEYGLGEELENSTLPIVLRFENGKGAAKYTLEHGEESYEVQGKSTIYRELRKVGDANNDGGISEVTLIIKKRDAMENMVIVDYPDFRRRPTEQKITMIKEKYLASHDTVLLNVVAANSPQFLSANSLTMLTDEMLDKMLLVITCSEESPSNLLQMVEASDYWNRGLGVAFIRHRSRFGLEKHSVAVHEEKELFRTHPSLSPIDKSMVGIPQLVKKLGRIQSALLAKCLPRICRSLDDRISQSVLKLNSLSHSNSRLAAFLSKLSSVTQNSLSPFLEFNDRYARIAHPRGLLKILDQSLGEFSVNFLSAEILIVSEFPEPDEAFKHAILNHIGVISKKVLTYFKHWCDQAEADIKSQFLLAFATDFDDLLIDISKAVSYVLKLHREKFETCLSKYLEGEKIGRYKSNPEIEESIKHLMDKGLPQFRSCVLKGSQKLTLKYYEGFIDVSTLQDVDTNVRENAYKLKVSFSRHMPIVHQGIVDATVLNFETFIKTLVGPDFLSHILQEMASSGPSDMMQKFPCPPEYNKGIAEKELEGELSLYAATRAIASRATKWLPQDH